MTFSEYYESKKDYEVYHNSYTSCVDEVLTFIEKNGYEYTDEDVFQYITTGPKKPSDGKTIKVSLPLYKNGKLSKKVIHFQVYNRETDEKTYELNMYIS